MGALSPLFVAKLLGHKQSSTMQRFVHLAEDPVRQAEKQISEAIATTSNQLDLWAGICLLVLGVLS